MPFFRPGVREQLPRLEKLAKTLLYTQYIVAVLSTATTNSVEGSEFTRHK